MANISKSVKLGVFTLAIMNVPMLLELCQGRWQFLRRKMLLILWN